MNNWKKCFLPNKYFEFTLTHTIITCLFLLILTKLALPSEEENTHSIKPHIPFYGKLQYAGNIGMFSIGVGGIFLNNSLSLDINYGYLPKWINGVRVSTMAIKGAFHFFKKQLKKIEVNSFAGLSLNYSITNNTFLMLPKHYPDGYYLPNAIHVCPFIGTGLAFIDCKTGLHGPGVYTEVGTVDYMVYYAFRNKSISLFEIWNLCFGITVPIVKG